MTRNKATGHADRSTDVRAEKPTEKPHHYGYFQAKFLPALRPFVEYLRVSDPQRFFEGNITMEPCADGGAYIVAITGHATVIIRDPQAYVDSVVTLDIPRAAFDAAQGTTLPTMHGGFDGAIDLPVPEWLQPGMIYVYTAGIHISPKMRHPEFADEPNDFQPALFARTASTSYHEVGIDYRMSEGRPAEWRKLLGQVLRSGEQSAAPLFFNPIVPSLFIELMEACEPSGETFPLTMHTVMAGPQAGTVLLRFVGIDDVIGLWTCQKPDPQASSRPLAQHFLDLVEEQTP